MKPLGELPEASLKSYLKPDILICQKTGHFNLTLTYKYVDYLQNKGVATPTLFALGTGIKSPVITSKINPYIGISDGISG